VKLALLAYRGTMRSGGLGIYLRDLTYELASAGHEIDLFVGPPYPDPMPWLREHRIHNDHFWDRRFRASWRAPIPEEQPFRIFRPLAFFEFASSLFGFLPEPFAFSVRAARAIVASLRAGARYDLVHDVQTLGYGLLWLRALGLPVVSTVHHPLTVDRQSSLRRDRTFREMKGTLTFYPVRTQARVARRVDAMITSSRASVGEIARGFGVPEARIFDVGNGVKLPPRGPRRARPAKPQLLFLGRRNDPNKGFTCLLQALARLPADVTLRVMDSPPVRGETELLSLVADLKLHDRVRFEGKIPRPDLEAALASAAVVVVPSLFEGFGLPIVEALAAGTPVVATTAGAIPEVAARAGAGRLVAPSDAVALAAAIVETLRDWDREHHAAHETRARIEAEFGWPHVAARTAEIYARVLATRAKKVSRDEART
jgi:glycosyltransferase involved in cell wall biosynthesis